MTPIPSDPERTPNGEGEFSSVADELKRESERLRHLAEKLRAREESFAEMVANYPHFREFVYAKIREEFERTLEELPDKDLEAYAQELEAQPLEAFIDDLEKTAEGPDHGG